MTSHRKKGNDNTLLNLPSFDNNNCDDWSKLFKNKDDNIIKNKLKILYFKA